VNVIDGLAVAYMAFGAWRGRARGSADEGYRLIRMGIAYAFGCGLYEVISQALKSLLSLGGNVAGPVGFVGVIGGAWYLTRFVKKDLTAFLAARFASHARLVGAIAGGARTLLVALSIVGVFHLAGNAPGRDQVSEDSWVGRVASWVMPGK